ncbi:MAG: recombinase [Azospirillum sp.]|nr:recombinase [Azospirillum sp.]
MKKSIMNRVIEAGDDPVRAVIYCRVSDHKQTTDGDGLASQETRCREYAKHRGMTVERVFADDMSGKFADRPDMRNLLLFLHDAPDRKYAVVVDDLSRLARDVEAYRALRRAISEAGGVLMSPSIKFGEDSDSTLIENLLASVAQHQREKNGEQTRNRMWGRAKNGYWVFPAMPGYRFEKVKGHNKLLVRDEPAASVLREALEGFAAGRFETQKEVKEFLDNNPLYPKGKAGYVHFNRVKEILMHPLYAGYVDIPSWQIHMEPGKHEALIDYATFMRVQDRLAGRAKAPKRVDIREDFPLRGFVACDCCGEPYTSCWSKGSTKRYPYYLCDTRGCPEYRKSIRKEVIEAEFEQVLAAMKPAAGLVKLAKAMFRDMWDQVHGIQATSVDALKAELRRLDQMAERLMDRILEGDDALIAGYEKRLAATERERVAVREKIAGSGRPRVHFENVYRTVFDFLENPQKLWCSSHLEHRRAVLRMGFQTHLRYARHKGYRTPKTTLPFRVLGGLGGPLEKMVPRRRLELPRPFGH